MTNADEFALAIRSGMPTIKSGTMRFWGVWFGRPHDNIHFVIGAQSEDDVLTVTFNEDEVLRVWRPNDFQVSEQTFRIGSADRVRWEWFYYGRPKIPTNLYFNDFIRTSSGFENSTNVDWYKRQLEPSLRFAAVEIL